MTTRPLELIAMSLAFAVAAPLGAQLRINELSLDPVGPNAGAQIVELINVSGAPVVIGADWSICIRPLYPPMPQVTIPTSGIVRVHIGQTGTDTATDWFLPGVTLAADGEFALYRTNIFFDDITRIMDFASWGAGAPFTRIVTAVQAGLWPALTAHLTIPAEGNTLAWFGTGSGPSAFFDDSTPTLGAPNQPATSIAFGSGCPGTAGTPTLAADPAAPLPWLGSPFGVRIGSLPANPTNVVFLVTSLTETPPSSLAAIGMPGCDSYLTPDVVQLALAPATGLTLSTTFPADPAFAGARLLRQAAVLDLPANAMGLVLSNPMRMTTGLR